MSLCNRVIKSAFGMARANAAQEATRKTSELHLSLREEAASSEEWQAEPYDFFRQDDSLPCGCVTSERLLGPTRANV